MVRSAPLRASSGRCFASPREPCKARADAAGPDPSRRRCATPQDEGRESSRGLEKFVEPATSRHKQKRTNLRWSSLVARTDPILSGPGGLGAEESGTERTGSTHTGLFAM